MSAPSPERRLAAILCADVAAFSRMVQDDEAGTLDMLRERRRSIIEPAISKGGGRIVKHTGDGLLAEFPSAVNAVSAALDLQARMAASNAGLPPDRQMVLRIGVNLGDIIGEGDDIFGDGVNIAARLESVAEPGGIAVSGKVRDEAHGKISAHFIDVGEKHLKNMVIPVRVYRVADATAVPLPSPHSDARLSVAVLPFTSLGADPDQQYFGDGLTEDIITELARIPILRVASRNGAFRFRGPDADIAAAARTLDARYIVEGSVRRLGPRIRITAQLIDSTNGAHLWAERYDRPADEIFDVQDDVIRTIVGTLSGRIQSAGAALARRKPPASLAAYDLVLQAEHADWSNAVSRQSVRELARRALALDPGIARGELLLGIMSYSDWLDDLSVPDAVLEEALEYMRRAVALDPNDFYCHVGMGEVCLYLRNHDLSARHLERARELNPARPSVYMSLAHHTFYSGRANEALDLAATARRVDAYYEPRWFWSSIMMMSYGARRYAEAVDVFHRIDAPREWILAYAAAAHAMLGDAEQAKAYAAAAVRASPEMTVVQVLSRDPFRNPADREHVMAGMRKAGLPG